MFLWSHLWFLAYLLIFNLVTFPILLRISSQIIQKITTFINSHLVYLPMVIFSGIMATFGSQWPLFVNGQTLTNDWGYFTYNLFAFIIGYLLFLDQRLGKTINSKLRWWMSLFLGSSVIRLVLLGQYQLEGFYGGSQLGRHLVCSIVTGVHTWSAIAFFLALAHRYLENTNTDFLIYMKKASLPFYILHYPITIILGTYIKPLGLGVLPEFLLLSVLTIIITTLAYEFLVKPWPVAQSLLGLK